jgi:hypothetical protein
MRSAGYCFNCGEQIKKRLKRLLAAPLCADCARYDRRFRFLRLASVILSAAIIFLAGRLTARREPPQFIGAPVDTGSLTGRPATEGPVAKAGDTKTARAADATCGAPTKSGRPCQRKVKDTGYCWQHRDRFGPKKDSTPAR